MTQRFQRPLLFGSFGADFALAAVMGPLLGAQCQGTVYSLESTIDIGRCIIKAVFLLTMFHGGKGALLQ
jgi:hypothetical protein